MMRTITSKKLFPFSSSAVNAMIYVRGNDRDYDEWNIPGWSFNELIPYFKKSENNRQEWLFELTGDKYHGRTGELHIDGFNSIESIKTVVFEAVFEIGYVEHMDINADDHIGFVQAQGTIKGGERHSAASAFLLPVIERENLHIIKHATVTNVLIENDQAKGIVFEIGDKKLKAIARKEVILSAGAVNSPKILMQSGIGKAEDLRKLEIPVVKELPVGENLHDHVMFMYNFKYHKTRGKVQSPVELADGMFSYLKHRVGKFTGTGCSDMVGFVNTTQMDAKYPDIQYLHVCQAMDALGFDEYLQNFGFKNEFIHNYLETNKKQPTIQFLVTLLRPKSRGYLKLRSKDPHDSPIINPNYLDEEEDIETLLRGLKLYRKLLDTESFKLHEIEEHRFDIPECDKFEYATDEYWRCYISYFSTTMFHPVGTCKLGNENDKSSVVTPSLKVKGIKGLRVIDASVIPTIISANTNPTTLAVAEKGSDLIKADWAEVKAEEIK